jgi:predicted Zn-ribbon and HTH transcriptional regulator
MSKWIVDIHGDIEGDYEIIKEYEEPKTGHWIVKKDCEGKTRKCICDKCGYETGKYTWKNPNYCAECGASMINILMKE